MQKRTDLMWVTICLILIFAAFGLFLGFKLRPYSNHNQTKKNLGGIAVRSLAAKAADEYFTIDGTLKIVSWKVIDKHRIVAIIKVPTEQTAAPLGDETYRVNLFIKAILTDQWHVERFCQVGAC